MRQSIDRILRGQFHYDTRELSLSVARLEIDAREGIRPEGVFEVFSAAEEPLSGFVSSTDSRMEVLTPEISGSRIQVSWRFDNEGLLPGDESSGSFRIVSDQGETMLPYTVRIRHRSLDSSMGEIVNLFHFANLAQSNWNEALELFYSGDFDHIFTGTDTEFETMYRGLSKNAGSHQGMEEFLLSVNKKQKVSYKAEPAELIIDNPVGLTDRKISLTRTGWGLAEVRIKAEGDFIITDKTSLSAADFAGNTAAVNIRIDPAYLHDGENFGRIVFEHAYGEVTVEVRIRQNLDISHLMKQDREEKRLTLKLMRLYEDFRSGRITSRVWLNEAGRVITKLTAMFPERTDIRLFTAQYLITSSRDAEGQWILEQEGMKFRRGETVNDTLYCYYLYLTSLLGRKEDETDRIAGEIEVRFARNPSDFRIAWLLQYVSRECAERPDKRYKLLAEQVKKGCRSPLIYLEAMLLLSQSPNLLIHLADAEISILRYGAKKGLFSDNLTGQIVYIARREKNYDARILEILEACCNDGANSEALEAVCTMLIKGGRTDRDAFRWYSEGVKKGLRITRLYEYYMMSIYEDENGLLPCEISRMVLMYFSYQSNLDHEKNAILYRYIHEHREEMPELFATYRPQIGKFLMQQLDKGRVNTNLAYLYQNMLTRQMVDMENSSKVLAIANSYRVITDERDIRKAIVVYDKCEQEVEAVFNAGEAVVPLYGSAYRVFLEDSEGRRFLAGRKYELRRLLPGAEIVDLASPFLTAGRGNLDMYLSELGRDGSVITMENVERYRDLASSSLVREPVRILIQEELIRFYYDNDFQTQLAEYLNEVDETRLSASSRIRLAQMLILSGSDERALSILMHGAIQGADPKLVLRMMDRLLERGDLPAEDRVVDVAWYAFSKGKYDAQLLSYLSEHFEGTSIELWELMMAAESFGVDTYGLSEKLITQLLYSGALPDKRYIVYESFVKRGGSGDIERAFLAQSAYDDLVRRIPAREFVYDQIERLCSRGEVLPDICAMSYLEHKAGSAASLTPEEEKLAAGFLAELLSGSVFFPFFKEYSDLIPVRERMLYITGRTYLEYRGKKGARLIVHYRRADEVDAEYKKTAFSEMADGIFIVSFLLFEGEELTYYVTEESSDGRNERMVMSGTVEGSGDRYGEESRYTMINSLIRAQAAGDMDEADELIDDYCRKDFLSRMIFTPVSVSDKRTTGGGGRG